MCVYLGCTITLSIIAAAGAAAVTFPASSIQGRIGVSVAVSSASIVVSASTVISLASQKMGTDLTAAVITAAAMSVAFAAAWAVGVMVSRYPQFCISICNYERRESRDRVSKL